MSFVLLNEIYFYHKFGFSSKVSFETEAPIGGEEIKKLNETHLEGEARLQLPRPNRVPRDQMPNPNKDDFKNDFPARY